MVYDYGRPPVYPASPRGANGPAPPAPAGAETALRHCPPAGPAEGPRLYTRRTKPPAATRGNQGLHSLAELGDPLFESTRRCFRRIGSVSPACGDSDPLGPCSFRFPGRFAPKLRGASAAASDLATVSLGPNSLTSLLGGGVPPFESMTALPRRSGWPSESQSNARGAGVNAFDIPSGWVRRAAGGARRSRDPPGSTSVACAASSRRRRIAAFTA